MQALNRQESVLDRQDAKTPREPDLELDELAHRVIGAAIEVHRILGPGYLESVYEEALAIEFELREIPFERQKAFPVAYKGRCVHEGRVDFLVGRQLIVELKAVATLVPIYEAVVLSHMKAGRLLLGLLLNFHAPVLKEGIRRVVLSS